MTAAPQVVVMSPDQLTEIVEAAVAKAVRQAMASTARADGDTGHAWPRLSEAAKILGCSPATLSRLAASGQVPASALMPCGRSKRLRFSRAWLVQSRVA